MSRPLQNRVAPDGTIHAVTAKGDMMGNRVGRLHTDQKHLTHRRWAGKAWITCALTFKDRQREVMGPGYTELFFLDEITALTAGHRPCFECRRADAVDFATRWNTLRGEPGRAYVKEMDKILHAERLTPQMPIALESAAPLQVVQHGQEFVLILTDRLLRWSFKGYTPVTLPSRAKVTPLMPPSALAVVSSGYAPSLHRSASPHPAAPATSRG